MSSADTRMLLAVIYDDGIAADRMLSDLGYALRDSRVRVKGLVQRNTFKRDRTKCDMELEELGSGMMFQLSEHRGKHAGGCRLDREALTSAAALIGPSLKGDCELLIINKFGRSEVEGRGLREVIVEAVEREIATIVGVPRRNLEVWRRFADGLFDQCHIDESAILLSWVEERAGCKVPTGSLRASGELACEHLS
jgi:hypothetical protein